MIVIKFLIVNFSQRDESDDAKVGLHCLSGWIYMQFTVYVYRPYGSNRHSSEYSHSGFFLHPCWELKLRPLRDLPYFYWRDGVIETLCYVCLCLLVLPLRALQC